MRLYPILAGTALALATALPALAGTLDDVKQRGVVHCGNPPNIPGYAFTDDKGERRGFDVDTCKALAAAVLGDATKIKLTAVGPRDALATLATGGVDILTHRMTWTFNRDNGSGIEFVMPLFYDGQGFMVRKSANIKSATQLDGASICAAQGTTTELNIADWFRSKKLRYSIVTFAEPDEARSAYDSGRCDSWTNDLGSLAARGLGLKNRDEHIILPETISKEPIGPVVRQGDSQWMHVARWTFNALIAAEELGVTQANVDEMKARSENPEIKRLLGVGDDLGQKLGLKADWAYQAIKAVGNYGEMFDRHLGPKTRLGLSRGLNALWTDGGLMMAPPFR